MKCSWLRRWVKKLESEELKCQFSQVERDLNLQKIPKPIPISKKRALRWNMKMKKLKKRPIVCNKSQIL
jgi:hypothetical protein